MSRHFASDAHVLETVDQELLDRLRRGAHTDSPNGILYEIATALLRVVRSDDGPETALRGDLSHTAPEAPSGTAGAEIVDPGPGSGPAAPDSGLVPVLRFTMAADHRWHPGAEFGVAADGRLLVWWDGRWGTSAYDDGERADDAGVVRAALRQAMQDRSEAWHVAAQNERAASEHDGLRAENLKLRQDLVEQAAAWHARELEVLRSRDELADALLAYVTDPAEPCADCWPNLRRQDRPIEIVPGTFAVRPVHREGCRRVATETALRNAGR